MLFKKVQSTVKNREAAFKFSDLPLHNALMVNLNCKKSTLSKSSRSFLKKKLTSSGLISSAGCYSCGRPSTLIRGGGLKGDNREILVEPFEKIKIRIYCLLSSPTLQRYINKAAAVSAKSE